MAVSGEVEISDVIRAGLSQVLSKELGSDKMDVSIGFGSNKGDNYLGIVYRVSAKSSVDIPNENENNHRSSIEVILKVAPKSEARREQFFSRDFFLREIQMYDEVLPMFRSFQESKGIVPGENGFHEYPNCYKTIDAEIDETLILQDMKADHFEMFDRFQLITIDHVRLIMQALGKYHALSFAMRDQQPEKFKCYSNMEEIFSRPMEDSFKAYSKQLTDNVYKALDQEGDERLLEKVRQVFISDQMTLVSELVKGASAEPYAVICHGDCWNNNILFKYDENKKPIDVRLLDWQISRYATPISDLVIYIFSSTTKPLRDQYYDDMIRTYHDSLSEMLIRLGSDPSKLFPFDALQKQLRQFGKLGLVMAVMMLPIITSAVEKCPDIDEFAETIKKNGTYDDDVFSPDAGFNKRMREVIVDMDRLGYI